MKIVIAVIAGILFYLTCSIADAASNIEKGKEAFEMNGCTGCHKIGKDYNGPDLSGVTTYRSKEWIIDFILNTKKYYDDPTVRAMINRFTLYMPNQGVEPEDAELIYDYLKSLEKRKIKK
ncbi:MAG: cytochrome c [Dissulfurispiraceae bacterium]|nr:cytochrome c [Dissulfurispiraceae bacterium]